MLDKIKNNSFILPIILSIFTYISLCYQDIIPINNIFSIFVLILIIYFYKNNLLKKSECNKDILIFSLFFAIILISGRILYNFRYSATDSFWNELFTFKNIIYLIGNTSLIYTILITAIPKLINIKFKDKKMFKKKHIFLWSLVIIFICWLPYFIVYYPGIITGDSLSELNMILGNKAVTDHHTVIHFIFMFIPYKIGYLISGNVNFSVGLISLVQMLVMASIFAYSISFLSKRNVNKYLLIAVLLFYAIVPVFGFYSITMWKDIIFSGMVLLLVLELIKLLERKNDITFKNSFSFIIISLLTIFFRNNAIYMYFILALVTLIIFRKKLKVIVPMLIIVFAVFFVVKGPIYNYFGIRTSKSSEYIAIPLQQIGRMAYKGVEFTSEEKELINELIPLKILRKSYNAEIVDSIKFNDNYNAEAFEENKIEYLKLWVSLCFKHFDIATEAYLTSTLGYYYPNVDYWVTTAKIDENDIGVHTSSFVPDNIRDEITKLGTRTLPIIGNTWCIALAFWLILLSAYIAVKRYRTKSILYVYVPILGIWLTMMVATPVFAEFRYIFSAFTCLPILLIVPFLEKRRGRSYEKVK